MAPAALQVSVIICTRNRAAALLPSLGSVAVALLQAAQSGPLAAEIIVVDNGSTDHTAAVISDWAAHCAFPVQAVTEPRKGLATARNTGIRHARGTLIVFTDDDCQLAPDYIVSALRHDAADTEPTLRGGRVELGDPTDLPFSIRTGQTAKTWQRRQASARDGSLNTALIGANMAMRRSLIDRLGPFDERFGAGGRFLGGEEIDYLYRAYLADVLIVYTPDMVIYHYHGRKLAAKVRDLVCQYDIGDGALLAKHGFKDRDLLRPLYWDVRKAAQEFFGGGYSRPALNISHRRRVWNVLQGMADFYGQSWRARLRGKP